MKLSIAGLALGLLALPARGNNPLVVTSTGTPYKWNSFPIIYTVDGGSLGALSNAEANQIAAEAFSAWTAVPSASLSVTQNAVIGLGSDGDIDTVAEFNALFPSWPCPNFNAIIYDSGGTITDGLFGAGASNSTLGFASPCLASAGNSILAMRAVMVVKNHAVSPVNALARSRILAVFIHEFGHGLGLGHSQVNLNCATNPGSCPNNTPGGDVFGVPTMFPTLLSQTETTDVIFSATLAADDISAISTLYPSAGFAGSFGTISGIVAFGDSINLFQGANVIARRVLMPGGAPGDPRVTAVSNVSGAFAQVDRGNPSLGRPPSPFGSIFPIRRGEYTIPGLPPGTYTVEVESVRPSFIGGSSVGPMGEERNENIPLSGPPEFFGGPESNADNPATAQILVLAAGNLLGNNIIILNDGLPTLDAFDAVARNETIATATVIGAGDITASISSSNAPDVDLYAIGLPSGQVLTVETFSKRLSPQRYLDSVIELMDALGNRLQSCRVGDVATALSQPCVDDDFAPFGGALTLDSKLTLAAGPAATVYLRVSDALGDFRPDFIYNLATRLASPQAQAAFPPGAGNFPTQYIGVSTVKSITMTNGGTANMTLNSSPLSINSSVPNAFTLASDSTCTGGLILTPGGSCAVNVTFQAPALGPNSGTLSIASDAPTSPHLVGLSGSAADFRLLIGSSSDTFSATPGQQAFFSFNCGGDRNPDAISLSVSGLPAGTSSSFDPPSLAAFTLPRTFQLLVKTTSRSQAPPEPLFQPVPPLLILLGMAGLAALGIKQQSATTRRWIASCGMLAIVILLTGLQACGGKSGSGGAGGGGGTGAAGTPAGTYPLTITATSGPITRTATVTLIVQ